MFRCVVSLSTFPGCLYIDLPCRLVKKKKGTTCKNAQPYYTKSSNKIYKLLINMSLKYCAIEYFVLIVTTFRISNATLPNFLAVKLSKQRFKHYESFTRVPYTQRNLSIFCPIHHICYLFQ